MSEISNTLSRRIYYSVKPLLPRRLRLALRRKFAREILSRSAGIWPINPDSGETPADWPGWPEGRKFALVLTHDVEGSDGLGKVRQLAELEMAQGFCSSFNFIPEGDYRVTDELRDWLTGRGFEVGVHDLHHNGKLYHSRRLFHRKAKRINGYLKAWQAVGFRSAFMLRQLDWLHDLNLSYDASTFDTDPFEPQPGGCGTIFPFFIGKEAELEGSGYVELPYTLPQDSTLFLLLEERSPEVWLRKLDWIAERGGMALVNVHPDYLYFNGESAQDGYRYPVSMYESLLSHVRDRYGDACWNPLARDLAGWYRASRRGGSGK